MMKKIRPFSLLFAFLFLLLMTAGCTSANTAPSSTPTNTAPSVTPASTAPSGTPDADSSEPIKIGNLQDLTGATAQHGIGARVAIEMMVDEINASGGLLGRQIKLITYDCKGDVAESVNAYKRLVEQDKVVAINHTAVSNVALAIGPVAESYKIPTVGPFIDPKGTMPTEGKLMHYMFMSQSGAKVQGKFMADYAMDKYGYKHFGVLYDNTNALCVSLMTPFVDEVKAKGGTTDIESFQASDSSYLTQLNKLKGKNPDAYYFPVYTNQANVVVKQAREVGIDKKIFGSLVFYPGVMLAGDAAEKDVEWPYTVDFTQPGYDDFAAKFTQKTGFEPSAQAMMSADGFKFIVEAIKKANSTDPEAIKNALEGLTITGWQGTFTMDPATHRPEPGISIGVVNIVDGKLNLLEMRKSE
jgi:branched-chain amino acid transport system substrate-binding protein